MTVNRPNMRHGHHKDIPQKAHSLLSMKQDSAVCEIQDCTEAVTPWALE